MQNMAALANPYMNPYANPFLNPYLTQSPQQQMGVGNAAMYFFAAQQMNGGIGSGRLGGPRAGQSTPAISRAGPQSPAQASEPSRSANVPGAGASRFFPIPRPLNPVDPHVSRFYNRQNKHFPNIAH
jgi:hypothetical protein